MLVRELIEALQQMPPDAEVRTEGCDCFGDVGRVSLAVEGQPIDPAYPEHLAKETRVLLERSPD